MFHNFSKPSLRNNSLKQEMIIKALKDLIYLRFNLIKINQLSRKNSLKFKKTKKKKQLEQKKDKKTKRGKNNEVQVLKKDCRSIVCMK